MPFKKQYILLVCHGYNEPFLSCAQEYIRLLKNKNYAVVTLFLTGKSDKSIIDLCQCEEVCFAELASKQIRGIKLRAIHYVRRLHQRYHFNVCIAHRFKSIWTCCLASSLPVIGVHHGFGDYRRLGRKAFAWVMRHRLKLIAVSDALRDEIRQDLSFYPKEHIETLYNSLNFTQLQKHRLNAQQAKAALGVQTNGWIIGVVGRLHPEKDPETVLRAFALALPSLPHQAELLFLGQGRLLEPLQRLAHHLGIEKQIKFLGHVNNAPYVLPAFDVLVLASKRESFGLSLLEAMDAGVPVIGTQVGGIPEVVGSAGQLFTVGDYHQLADKLVETSQMTQAQRVKLKQDMQQQIALCFSEQAIKQQFEQLACIKQYLKEF